MIIPVGYCQTNLKFTGSSAPSGAEITLGLDLGGIFSEPSAVADAVEFAWNNAGVAANQSNTITLSSILVKFGPNSTGASHELTTATTGGDSGAGLWPGSAVLVTKATAAGGRAGKGRFFLPGIGESAVNQSGVVGDTFLGNLQTDLDTFYDNLVGGDLQPVVLHGASSPISSPTPITAFIAQPQIATQRRRNRR